MNDQVDMSHFVEAKSDQINADDLIGGPRTITVRKVTGEAGDQPVSIYFDGDNNKPFKPCKTIRRVLLAMWGRYAADYVGRSMTIYRDDRVTFGGLETGGIRISHLSNIAEEKTVVVLAKKGKKAGVKVKPLAPQAQAEDGALKWTNGYIAKVEGAKDRVELEQHVEQRAAKLAELKTARPELHQRCEDAVAERRAGFANDGTLSDENPSASEGPSDEQRGDGFTDDA